MVYARNAQSNYIRIYFLTGNRTLSHMMNVEVTLLFKKTQQKEVCHEHSRKIQSIRVCAIHQQPIRPHFSSGCRCRISCGRLFIPGQPSRCDRHGVECYPAERSSIRSLLCQRNFGRPIVRGKDPGGTTLVAPAGNPECGITAALSLPA